MNDMIRIAKPGEIITFGRYLHTEDGSDSTPTQWLVLEITGSVGIVLGPADLFVLQLDKPNKSTN